MIKNVLSLLLVCIAGVTLAQNADGPQMADALRENGKIYIVISVIGLIFISLALFLVFIERKVKKLEDELKNK